MRKVGTLPVHCPICDEILHADILAGVQQEEDGHNYIVTDKDVSEIWMHYFVNHPEECE